MGGASLAREEGSLNNTGKESKRRWLKFSSRSLAKLAHANSVLSHSAQRTRDDNVVGLPSVSLVAGTAIAGANGKKGVTNGTLFLFRHCGLGPRDSPPKDMYGSNVAAAMPIVRRTCSESAIHDNFVCFVFCFVYYAAVEWHIAHKRRKSRLSGNRRA